MCTETCPCYDSSKCPSGYDLSLDGSYCQVTHNDGDECGKSCMY